MIFNLEYFLGQIYMTCIKYNYVKTFIQFYYIHIEGRAHQKPK
jgi:hypothetical protein